MTLIHVRLAVPHLVGGGCAWLDDSPAGRGVVPVTKESRIP
jgi:hypothetical protein